jgi:hypothetical protein
MPQASDEMRAEVEKVFGDPVCDSGPWQFLRENGFTEKGGLITKPGIYWADLSEKEKLALEFLADEWDYAWDFRAPPQTDSREG